MNANQQNNSNNVANTQNISAKIVTDLTAAASNVGVLVGYIAALEAQVALLSEKLEERGVDVKEVMKELPIRRRKSAGEM